MTLERVVEGELGRATFDRMVEVLRAHISEPGVIQKLGPSWVWTWGDPGGAGHHLNFTMTPSEGRTTIVLDDHARPVVDSMTLIGVASGLVLSMLPIIAAAVLLPTTVVVLVAGASIITGALCGGAAGRWLAGSRLRRDRELLGAEFECLVAVADPPSG